MNLINLYVFLLFFINFGIINLEVKILIYTVTFNPAIDYVLKANSFEKNKINKSENEKIFPGGKGINVSIVLNNLGIESKVLGFIAGFTGNKIEEMINKLGVKTEFINLKNGNSRINIKIDSDNKETAINCTGPKIEKEELRTLIEKIEMLKDDDILVLAGSIPNGIENNIYEIICERLQNKKIKVIVDATSNLLTNVLKYRPYLIKPNDEELGEIFNVEIKDENDAYIYAKKLQEQGAQNVVVSLGAKGALMIDSEKNKHFIKAPKGERINTVGSGDSMVAGIIAGFIQDKNYEEILKLGVACGSATACSEFLAEKSEIQKFYEMIKN